MIFKNWFFFFFFKRSLNLRNFLFQHLHKKGSTLAIDMKNWKSLIKRLFVMSTIWANQNQSFFYWPIWDPCINLHIYNFTLVFYFLFFSEICEVDSICKNLVESLTFINDMFLENHPKFKTLTKCSPPPKQKSCVKSVKILINFFLLWVISFFSPPTKGYITVYSCFIFGQNSTTTLFHTT